MKTPSIILMISGLIFIIFPQIIGYLIGGLLLTIGILSFRKNSAGNENVIKYGKYKIYR